VAAGTVYFGGNDGKLYAADAKTGETVWTVGSRGYLSSAPLLAHGMLFMSGPVGLDPKTGEQVWGPRGARLRGFQRAVERSVALVDQYVVEGGGPCDVESATFLFGGGTWARQVTDAVADGIIYTCQTGVGGGMYGDKGNGTLHAVDLVTGEDRWAKITHRQGTPQAWREVLMCSPAVHHGIVYIGSEHGELFALDAKKGTQLFSFDAQSAIRSAPSISTRDGTLYFGAADGKLYALDAKSGRKKWEFPTEDKIVSSPCPNEGCVYVGSDDGHLYALEAE
jgi:outer membrane protein assembly factor BamB